MILKSNAKRVAPERLYSLVACLRDGDESVAKEIINGHIGMAISLAKRYTNKDSSRYEDVIATALLALVEAVHRAKTKLTDNNITPYLYSRVRGQVITYICNDHLIRVPPRTYSKMREVKIQPLVKTIDLREDEDRPDDGYNQYVELLSVEDDYEILFMEIIDSLNFSDRERFILDKLVEGYTQREIAEELNCSFQNVSLIQGRIRERIAASDICN